MEVRKLKANLVSVNVDRLVQEGYLIREAVEGDRRKTQLICTEKAAPLIARGQKLQREFGERLLKNIDPETRNAFFRAIEIVSRNLDAILEGEH